MLFGQVNGGSGLVIGEAALWKRDNTSFPFHYSRLVSGSVKYVTPKVTVFLQV